MFLEEAAKLLRNKKGEIKYVKKDKATCKVFKNNI